MGNQPEKNNQQKRSFIMTHTHVRMAAQPSTTKLSQPNYFRIFFSLEQLNCGDLATTEP